MPPGYIQGGFTQLKRNSLHRLGTSCKPLWEIVFSIVPQSTSSKWDPKIHKNPSQISDDCLAHMRINPISVKDQRPTYLTAIPSSHHHLPLVKHVVPAIIHRQAGRGDRTLQDIDRRSGRRHRPGWIMIRDSKASCRSSMCPAEQIQQQW